MNTKKQYKGFDLTKLSYRDEVVEVKDYHTVYQLIDKHDVRVLLSLLISKSSVF